MKAHGHGTRGRYKAGCRCFRCRGAEAAYRSALRWWKRKARPGAGTTGKAWAIEARRLVRRLVLEQYPKTRIARLAGWKDGRAYHVTFRPGQRIRRSTLKRIRAVADLALLDI